MKLRKITSLTALLSFVFLTLTSLILFIVPHGRVAYRSDWRLWGLSKTQWSDLHINIGFLFLIAIFVHIYYNWKPALDIDAVMQALAAEQIQAPPEMSIKEIGQKNKMSPIDIYTTLRNRIQPAAESK